MAGGSQMRAQGQTSQGRGRGGHFRGRGGNAGQRGRGNSGFHAEEEAGILVEDLARDQEDDMQE